MLNFIKLNKGLTLVEVLVVVVIIGILAAIAVPSVVGVIDKSKRDVCKVNLEVVERTYETKLTLENIEHSDTYFNQHLLEFSEDICPEGGDISYVDGEVNCSIHDQGEEEDSEEDGGSVPFL